MPRKPKKQAGGEEWTAFGLAFLVALGIVWLLVNYSAPVEQAAKRTEAATSPYFAPGDEFREQDVLDVDGTQVTIGRGCLAIIAETSPERAEAIELALANKSGERPNAYDGWASVLEEFNIAFEATTLYGRSEGAYLSRAIFRSGNSVLDLDMRPSDAIALALRTDTPIYLNMTLLREVGENIC
ncbi:MAG: DUF151 domain-containing protein [Candidatus Aenigmatarchaeota archaeon]